MSEPNPELDQLNAWMRALHMHGFWVQGGGGTGVQVKPHLWKSADRAVMTLPDPPPTLSGTAEPKTLVIRNPEQRGVPGAMSLSSQVLLSPGERATTRRAFKNQVFFVVGASRGTTVVIDGEPFPMERGDLIVAPLGTGCTFQNGGAEPVLWLNCTDADLLRFIGVETQETDDAERPQGYFAATRGRMKDPLEERPTIHADPSFEGIRMSGARSPARYPWSDTFVSLVAFQREGGGDPYDAIHLRYTSPIDGGSTLPTLSCEVQLLPSGLRTRAHRHNSTAIYYVFEGQGRTDVAGEQLEWAQGDVFCIPPWAWHHHENLAHDEAILYSIDDWPTMTKMGFYRIEREEA